MLLLAAVPLLALSCGDKGGGDEPGEETSGVTLRLSFPRSDALASGAGSKAVVNGSVCTLSQDRNGYFVSTDKSENGQYEVIYPSSLYSRVRSAFVLPPAQTGDGEGRPQLSSFPYRGEVTGADYSVANVDMQPLAAYISVSPSGGRLRTLMIESSGRLSGTWNLSGGSLTADEGSPLLPFVSFNAGSDGTSASSVTVAVPPGTYAPLKIRATDTEHHCVEWEIPSLTLAAGEALSGVEADFSATNDVLWAEHFDGCVWGGDPVGGRGGYGPATGSDTRARKESLYSDLALVAKDAGVPGTELFKTKTYSTRTWNLTTSWLGAAGLLPFDDLFYTCGYQGYIGGDPAEGYSNRPVVYLPLDMGIDEPRECTLSFRIASDGILASNIELKAVHAVLESLSVDGTPLSVDLFGSEYVNQDNSTSYVTAILTPQLIGDGKWHTVEAGYISFGNNATVRLLPTTAKDVNNVVYFDDFEVRRADSQSNSLLDASTLVEPTTDKGSASEDISSLRLMPSWTATLTSSSLYDVLPAMGITWVSGSMPHDEARWADFLSAAVSLKEASDGRLKIWSIHMPYGYRSEARSRDLCVPDESLHAQTVAFFQRAIRALAPLHPANVLVHCNQTLMFNDGSSADMMVRSLTEIAPVADSIGAHLTVENMSWGVGADPGTLSSCVDRANAAVSLKHDIRICMDTGHANCCLSTVGDGRTIADWARTAGTRIGDLHIHGNRGLKNILGSSSLTVYDDHLFPSYSNALNGYYDKIAQDETWGEFYSVLLGECLYRGPFVFEATSIRTEYNGKTLVDSPVTPASVRKCHDTYIYPEYRKYIGK